MLRRVAGGILFAPIGPGSVSRGRNGPGLLLRRGGTPLEKSDLERSPDDARIVLTRYQRTFNRFEFKYLVPHRVVARLTDELEGYVHPDPNWTDEWGYPVRSIYWDSDGLALFWEKIEGLKYRRKLRFRTYGDGSHVFIEIKQRLDRTVQKRRAVWPLERVQEVFGHTPESESPLVEDDDPIVSEAILLRHRYRLRPRMAIAYSRKAYYGTYEPDLRITFDRRVHYLHTHVDIGQPLEGGKYLVDPRLVIMEIKYSDRIPLWLCKLVSRHGLQMIRLSKYCTAVDFTYFHNRLT